MKKFVKIFRIIVVLCLLMSFYHQQQVYAASGKEVDNAIQNTAAYLLETVKRPQVGSIGGEWGIIGLARSDYSVPQSYWDDYYSTAKQYVVSLEGNLHDKKYTEYSRMILALTSIGADPSNVGGYNLLTPLGDFERTIWQGINGPIFALLALDSGNYEIPINKAAQTQATRELYIDEILARQLQDGGFALSGTIADPDITGMALQALAKYQNYKNVKTATEKAITILSDMQDGYGGYASLGEENSESTVQVLMALCELGIALDDSRFVKNGKTVIDNLLSYYVEGQGFQHTKLGSGVTGMSTEQALYGLVNAQRVSTGITSLYRMEDVARGPSANESDAIGLPMKHKDIKVMPVIDAGKTFADIAKHKNKLAIEALASRGTINGINADEFAPNRTITRAEFTAIVVRSLGLSPQASQNFLDVPTTSWYAEYVGSAHSYGIVNGTAENIFSPNQKITRQEAAMMMANAAKLSGMDTDLSANEIRDMLAQFGDYTKTAVWARSALAFNYKENILAQEMLNIAPTEFVTRADIAEMLYHMLLAAKLV